jgi:hypothetical protein
MQTLKMKIVGYEEESGSLLVAFASDETQHDDPAQYPAYAFQPVSMWHDVTDPEEIKKRIAVAGVWHAQNQAQKENFVADPVRVQQFKDMVGQTFEYPIGALVTTPTYDNEVQL